MTEFNITIEGPGGIGKTTLAKMISKRKFDAETQRTECIEQKVLKAEIKENPFYFEKSKEETTNVPKIDIFMHVEDKGGQVPFWQQYSQEFSPKATNDTKPNLVCLGYDMSEFFDSENKFSNTSLKKIVQGDTDGGCLPWILIASKDSNVKVSTSVQKMPILLVGLKADMISESVFRKMKKYTADALTFDDGLKEEFPFAYHGGEGIEAMITLLAYKLSNDAGEILNIHDDEAKTVIKNRLDVKRMKWETCPGEEKDIDYITKKDFDYMGAGEQEIRNWEDDNGVLKNFAARVEESAAEKINGLEELVKDSGAGKIFIFEEKEKLNFIKEQAEALQAYFAQRTSAVTLARMAKYELGLNVIGVAETSSALGLTHEVESVIAEQIKQGNYKR